MGAMSLRKESLETAAGVVRVVSSLFHAVGHGGSKRTGRGGETTTQMLEKNSTEENPCEAPLFRPNIHYRKGGKTRT